MGTKEGTVVVGALTRRLKSRGNYHTKLFYLVSVPEGAAPPARLPGQRPATLGQESSPPTSRTIDLGRGLSSAPTTHPGRNQHEIKAPGGANKDREQP